MTIISPNSFTFWESVVVFAVVILSGSSSQIGVLLGTFLIISPAEMFRDFASARMLVFGLAMTIMMVNCARRHSTTALRHAPVRCAAAVAAHA